MSQEILFRTGSLQALNHILEKYNPALIFLVTGKGSYSRSGAAAHIGRILKGRDQVHFRGFRANPRLEDLEAGTRLFRQSKADLILAVGGGSVLDMAKLVGILATQDCPPRDIVTGRKRIHASSVPVIAVPTTAGSGSEATHFAVVFLEETKFSVAHPSMWPTCALIDPELTYSLPPRVTAVTGLDAFTQAVESMWSIHATEQSRAYARKAIELALANLPAAVQHPSPVARRRMSLAALLAGKAINISKTTAPHALSYTMTATFGIPHGHAAALSLAPILVYNSRVTAEDVMPPYTVDQVRGIMAELCRLLGCRGPLDAAQRITAWIESLGLPSRLSEVGIRTPAGRRKIVAGVNPERLANNPRILTGAVLNRILEESS